MVTLKKTDSLVALVQKTTLSQILLTAYLSTTAIIGIGGFLFTILSSSLEDIRYYQSVSALQPPYTARFDIAAARELAPGSLIKGSGRSVYFLGDDFRRYVFPTENTFFTWYEDFSSVVTITDQEMASFPLAQNITYRPGVKLVKLQSDPKVFAVDSGGHLIWIANERIAEELYGPSWNTQIDDIPVTFWLDYTFDPLPLAQSSEFDRHAIILRSPDIIVDWKVYKLARRELYRQQQAFNEEKVPQLPLIDDSLKTDVESTTPILPRDTTPPVFTSRRVSSLTDSQAVIRWTTGETSDGEVHYRKDLGELDKRARSSVHSRTHSLTLKGLLPDATYYYKIFATDASGNVNESTIDFFQTLPEGLLIDTTPPEVSALPGGGSFTEPVTVVLETETTSVIYYTINGTVPTEQSMVYTAPLHFSKSIELRFFAVDAAGNTSSVVTEVYALSLCGNMIIDSGEQCDDGNVIDADGCSSKCVEEYCGDGVLQEGLLTVNVTTGARSHEECDDGNNLPSDGCSPWCTIEMCGDAFIQHGIGEVCDSNTSPCTTAAGYPGSFLCRQDCRAFDTSLCVSPLRCGDGICSLGAESVSSCSADCNEICGDGSITGRETCDDGNTYSYDGCSAECRTETEEEIFDFSNPIVVDDLDGDGKLDNDDILQALALCTADYTECYDQTPYSGAFTTEAHKEDYCANKQTYAPFDVCMERIPEEGVVSGNRRNLYCKYLTGNDCHLKAVAGVYEDVEILVPDGIGGRFILEGAGEDITVFKAKVPASDSVFRVQHEFVYPLFRNFTIDGRKQEQTRLPSNVGLGGISVFNPWANDVGPGRVEHVTLKNLVNNGFTTREGSGWTISYSTIHDIGCSEDFPCPQLNAPFDTAEPTWKTPGHGIIFVGKFSHDGHAHHNTLWNNVKIAIEAFSESHGYQFDNNNVYSAHGGIVSNNSSNGLMTQNYVSGIKAGAISFVNSSGDSLMSYNVLRHNIGHDVVVSVSLHNNTVTNIDAVRDCRVKDLGSLAVGGFFTQQNLTIKDSTFDAAGTCTGVASITKHDNITIDNVKFLNPKSPQGFGVYFADIDTMDIVNTTISGVEYSHGFAVSNNVKNVCGENVSVIGQSQNKTYIQDANTVSNIHITDGVQCTN